ncbi:MAG: hypothetical protein PHE59_02530 [Patescibacteria group bacterium]|nr:hypothetical protein [Patescibacteria group bacterium]MDD5164361.1 hypothetical protein [Patescibacteria group bacterium]MDD5534271.1 hypothetical protein [Patescibacteria group bacterium]
MEKIKYTPSLEEVEKAEKMMTSEQREMSQQKEALAIEQEQKKQDFFVAAEEIIKKIKSIENISNEKRREIFLGLMEKINNVPNYFENSEVIEKRKEIVEMILPEYPVLEVYPGKEKAKYIGYSMEEYYNHPAAFSVAPEVGGEERKTGVIGDQIFYPDWNNNHNGQQLFVLFDNETGPDFTEFYSERYENLLEKYGFPRELSLHTFASGGMPYLEDNPELKERFEAIKEEFRNELNVLREEAGKYWSEVVQDKRTLRIAKLATLFLDGDFLMKDKGISNNKNVEDNPGYIIYKNK